MRDTTVGQRGDHSQGGAWCQEAWCPAGSSGGAERFQATGRLLMRRGLPPRRQRDDVCDVCERGFR
jgi:hypothetical protein